MTRLLATALLLAGCAPAPKPKPTPEPMPQWRGERVACIDHKGKRVVCSYTVDPSGRVEVTLPFEFTGQVVVKWAAQVVTRDEPLAKCYRQFDEMAAAFNEMKKANETLLSVVREYKHMVEIRLVAPTEPTKSSPPIGEVGCASAAPVIGPYYLGNSFSFYGDKIDRFYYGSGDSWCNVWADDKGIHWEECK